VINKLQKENDSLKGILYDIKGKYIFDNVSFRVISHEDSFDKVGDKYSGEFVIIAYNDDQPNIKFIEKISDTTTKNHEISISKYGGYKYQGGLISKIIDTKFEVRINDSIGKFIGIDAFDKRKVKIGLLK
jgi:hypothetical protein